MELNLFNDTVSKEKIIDYETSKPCSICLDIMSDQNKYCIEECNHEFHSKCLINWFRSGKNTCPICRGIGNEYNYKKSDMLFKLKLKYGEKNKNSPKEFTKIVKTYLKHKENVKKIEKERKLVLKELKDIKKNEAKKLSYYDFIRLRRELLKKSNQLWSKLRKERNKKYDLEISIENIPVIPIFLLRKKIRKRK
jgi:hypothetical protein